MEAVLEINDTTTLSIPVFCQMKAVYAKAKVWIKGYW